MIRPRPRCRLFPYTTLFRSLSCDAKGGYMNVALLDVATRNLSWVTDTKWEVFSGNFSPDGKSFTYKIGKHTSELQSRVDLVCRLLLEKKKDRRSATEQETTR